MYFVNTFVVFGCLFVCVYPYSNIVARNFYESEIVPDLINVPPSRKAMVLFHDSGKRVNLGNHLTPSEVKDRPEVTYPLSFEKKYYTLAFADPDAPNRQNPIERSFIHWLVGNIPETCVDEGKTIAEFFGSAPPPNSGEHRYTFLIFKQPCKLEFDEPILTTSHFKERMNFDMNAFVQKYNLSIPWAGNFFIASPE